MIPRRPHLLLLALVAMSTPAFSGYIPEASASDPVPSSPPTTSLLPPRTPPTGPDAAVRLLAAGDVACKKAGRCADAATSALFVRGYHHGVLALGDLQYHRGTLSEFRASYDKTWGAFKDVTYPVPGNHEYLTPGAKGYYAYFPRSRSTPVPLAGRPDLGWYSFDLGGWHITALNSNCGNQRCSPTSRQVRWLKRDLASSQARCKLAFWHHPRFSSGEHGDDVRVATLWRTALNGGVDLVLSGHDHIYERFSPMGPTGVPDDAGMVQFVIGTGGAALRPAGPPRVGSRIIRTDQFGQLELSLYPDEARWQFRSTTGASVDTGRLACK